MGANKFVIIGSVVGVALGLIIGGLIGHFVTKSQLISATNSASKSDSAGDANNRKQLFEAASAEEIRKVAKEFSSKPHLAGSDRNNELGEKIADTWSSYGFKIKREKYNVLLSYPGDKDHRNQAFIISSTGVEEFASQEVEEELVPNADPDDIVPPFNGYAKGATEERDTVYYVNYCRAEDFDYIKNTVGIDVNDSLVICRYGKIFRGNKVRFAQDNGAVGVILYNDPMENVYGVNATYNGTFPHSWYLPPSGVERGGTSLQKGDPLTQGFPAKEYANRRTVEQIREDNIIPNIPTQPVGYEDVKKFMEKLGGDEVVDGWKGKLDDITYRYGGKLPDGRKFKLVNNNEDKKKDIMNVFGIIEGSEEPDRYVIMGNHRDAWMNGATDAVSGTSVLMETSRAFYELMKTGWRPRRTIIFCSWDGEEYGIIGSIEWLDDVKVLVGERAVAYLNCDSGVVYNEVLKAAASPLLFKLMYDTALMVAHPNNTGETLYDEWLRVSGKMSDPDPKPKIGDLGSGSDHTGFYHRHGITSMDIVYYYDKSQTDITAYYPLYHTSYDTFENVEKFVDPDFTYHRALTQFFLEMTRSISDSVMIPFVTNDYAIRLKQVYKLLDNNVRPKLDGYKDGSLANSLDYLASSINKFAEEAVKFDAAVKALPDSEAGWYTIRKFNDQLFLLERAFLYPLGILDRKYIRHVVFAPSATDSYASAAFPGISDALYKIDNNNDDAWERVKVELTKAVYTIESATKAITIEHII